MFEFFISIKTLISVRSFPSVEEEFSNLFISDSSLSTFSLRNFSTMYLPTISLLAGSFPENSTLTGEPLISTFSLSPINFTEILYLSPSGGVKVHE